MSLLVRGLGLMLLVVSAGSASAGPVLDPAFDGDGLKLVAGLGNGVGAIGSCPTESGSLAVVAFDQIASQFVTLRLLPNGNLDTAFSGDGIERESAPPSWDRKNTVMACTGIGNGNAADDAMALAFVVPRSGGDADLTRLAHINLDTGHFATGYAGQALSFDISTLATGSAMLGDTVLGGFSRLGSGEWILVGQIRNAA